MAVIRLGSPVAEHRFLCHPEGEDCLGCDTSAASRRVDVLNRAWIALHGSEDEILKMRAEALCTQLAESLTTQFVAKILSLRLTDAVPGEPSLRPGVDLSADGDPACAIVLRRLMLDFARNFVQGAPHLLTVDPSLHWSHSLSDGERAILTDEEALEELQLHSRSVDDDDWSQTTISSMSGE